MTLLFQGNGVRKVRKSRGETLQCNDSTTMPTILMVSSMEASSRGEGQQVTLGRRTTRDESVANRMRSEQLTQPLSLRNPKELPSDSKLLQTNKMTKIAWYCRAKRVAANCWYHQFIASI